MKPKSGYRNAKIETWRIPGRLLDAPYLLDVEFHGIHRLDGISWNFEKILQGCNTGLQGNSHYSKELRGTYKSSSSGSMKFHWNSKQLHGIPWNP